MSINNIMKTKNVLNDNNNSEEKGKEKEKKNKNNNVKGSNGISNENKENKEFEEPIVSLFENCFATEPKKEIMLTKFLFTHKLSTSKHKEQVEAYRKCHDKTQRKKIKENLPCITPSGTFSQRQEFSLVKHTKLICIDVDSKDNQGIDLALSKHIIGQHCPYLYYAGLSLGGEGIFLIFRISNPECHKQHFNALALYLDKRFHLKVDMIVKNPVSLRVVSYDENPYYNPNPVPFEHIEANNKSAQVVRTVTDNNKIRESVERAVNFIWENRIDITNGYENWLKIGCALAHEFGEEGRDWFHMISRMYKDFHESDCDIQYSKCLRYQKETGVKIATFFYFCKKYGIKY